MAICFCLYRRRIGVRACVGNTGGARDRVLVSQMTALRVSARKLGDQLPIWEWVGDRTIDSSAQMRTVMGDWCEELVARCLRGHRHQTDSQADVCPDVELINPPLEGSHFVEVKSCRHAGALLFAKRLAKDRELEQTGVRLFYAFVRTTCALPVLPAQLFAIRDALARPRFQVMVVQSCKVRAWARTQEPRAMWSGGPLGYRMPWAAIERIARLESAWVGDYEAKANVYGRDVRAEFRGSVMWQTLPRLTDRERANANQLLFELSEQRLGVVLSPAPRPQFSGHMVRALTGRNPSWYRKLAVRFPDRHRGPRKGHRTGSGIRRYLIEDALERLANAGHPRTSLDMQLLPLIRESV